MSRVVYNHPAAIHLCTQHLFYALQEIQLKKKVICVCIGTDRSTGDSLGPIVGTLLTKQSIPDLTVLGTLEQPVHAINLHQTLKQIAQFHADANIIAIDACLGQSTSVGVIQIGLGPIKPGAGVNKDLPEVGHLHITGIVNVAGLMEYLVLQNTRLHMVMEMAEVISSALLTVFQQKLPFPQKLDQTIK